MTGLNPRRSHRSYRVVELLGQGGFAKVYRATPLGSGRAPDVAIKILNDAQPPDDVVQRFRDEARILGMVQDRALVQVEPALVLNHRWSVVMEYLSGSNCRALLSELGPLPPRVALEIVGEVARALGRLYYQPGPDGNPLRLIHRDIKPANIQLTHLGEVKLLDFGVARASFDDREAKTEHAVQGTYGYIAPERLKGIDGPAVDTYGLGMVLYKLVTGGPTKRRMIAEYLARTRGAEGHALALALEMAHLDHPSRPTLREVAECCADLQDRIDGPRLADWAAQYVPERAGTLDDPLIGEILRETAPQRVRKKLSSGRTWRRLVLAARQQTPWVAVTLAVVFLVMGAWAVLQRANPDLVKAMFEGDPPEAGLEPAPDATLPDASSKEAAN